MPRERTGYFSLQDIDLERSGGTLARRNGVNIVHLRGTYADMGRQHGELAAAVCGDVGPQYFNRLVENLLAHAVPALAGNAGRMLKWWFHRRNRARIGDDLRALLGAAAQVYGLNPVEAERIFLVPDIVHFLVGRAFPPLAAPPMCSGFFACGQATQAGKVLIGRNFDFYGRGVWNTNNAIIVMNPANGQPFCWLGSLGVTGSAQGFNESGLVVSLHTKFNRDVRSTGVPVFRLTHDILATCQTLDEAVALIKAQPRMSGLTLFVVDTHARTAAAVGFSANQAEIVRPENDVLVRTNHYTSEEMKRLEIAPHPWQRNSHGRFQRLTELLREKHGVLAADDIPSMLSDCTDLFEQRKRVAGSIVAGTNNAQSVAMSPDDDALWLGNADYPVCHSERFAGFRISALFAADLERCTIDSLPGGNQLDATERAALAEYEAAWSAHNDHLNSNLAVSHLRRAAAILPQETIFPRMAGIILLKERKYPQALPLLTQNTEYDYKDDLMRAESHIWLGRCLDLMGRRAEALAEYEKAAALDAPPVSTAAARHRAKPFRPRHLFNVSPEFITGTGIAKY